MGNSCNAAMKTDRPITVAQLRLLHLQLRNAGLTNDRKEIISEYTHGRTDSSRELTSEEARQLIGVLCGNDKRQKEIKAIWRLAFEMGFIYGNSRNDCRMNAAKLDSFCLSRGTVKKPLARQSLTEIRRTHRQFERMYSAFIAKKSEYDRVERIHRLIAQHSAKEDYETCAALQKELSQLITT